MDRLFVEQEYLIYICKRKKNATKVTMVNNEKFTKRLQKILTHYDISAASFADKIEVGRSSISHILSGRNKPSLDFVMKTIAAFPEIELDWLLNGKGNFPGHEENSSTPSAPESVERKLNAGNKNVSEKRRKLKKIIFIYEDDGFEVFEN